MKVEQLEKSNSFVIFLGCLVALGPMSIDAYLPMSSSIALYFRTDLSQVSLTMSTYLAGNAVGQFLGGTFSDQIGRKKIGLIGLLIFFIATMAIIFAANIGLVQVFRGIQAIGTGFVTVICFAKLRDVYSAEELATKISNVVLVVLLGPIFAPTIGVYMTGFGWQSVFVLLMFWSLALFFIYLLFIPETFSSAGHGFKVKHLFSSYSRVFKHRANEGWLPMKLTLFMGLSSAVFMVLVINSAYVAMGVFNMTPQKFAMIIALHGVVLILLNRLVVKILKYDNPMLLLKHANLVQVLGAASLLLSSLLDIFEPSLALPLSLLTVGVHGILHPVASGVYLGSFDEDVGAAASINATFVLLFSVVIGSIGAILSRDGLDNLFLIVVLSSLAARLVLGRIK